MQNFNGKISYNMKAMAPKHRQYLRKKAEGTMRRITRGNKAKLWLMGNIK